MDEQKVDIREFIDPSLSYFEGQKFGDFGFTIVFDGVDVPTGTACQTYFEDNYFGFQRGFDVTWDGEKYTPVGLPEGVYSGAESVNYRHFVTAAGDIVPLMYFYEEGCIFDGESIAAFEIGEGTITESAYTLQAKCDVFGNLSDWVLVEPADV
jgi:hypothetical protein